MKTSIFFRIMFGNEFIICIVPTGKDIRPSIKRPVSALQLTAVFVQVTESVFLIHEMGWTVSIQLWGSSEIVYVKGFYKALYKWKIFIFWRCRCQAQANVSKILISKNENKAGNVLTKSRRTGCIIRHLKGFLTGMLTWGSHVASTVGCHPLIMSHWKFKYDWLAGDANTEANSLGLFSHTFPLNSQNGSPGLSA